MNTTKITPPAGVSSDVQDVGWPLISAAGGPAIGKNARNLLSQKFGRLTVLAFSGRSTNRRRLYWLVRCECGTKLAVDAGHLTSGHTTSCGCYSRERTSKLRLIDLTGRRFGRLTVISRDKNSKVGHPCWRVRCECGSVRVVEGENLRAGRTKSCGCRIREVASSRVGDRSSRWNPRLTQKDRDHRRLGTPECLALLTLKKQIRKKDGLKCIVCGATNCELAVHHLEPWASNRKLRYTPANLVTLCKECHTQFHALYGNDCDLEDFEDYLKP